MDRAAQRSWEGEGCSCVHASDVRSLSIFIFNIALLGGDEVSRSDLADRGYGEARANCRQEFGFYRCMEIFLRVSVRHLAMGGAHDFLLKLLTFLSLSLR